MLLEQLPLPAYIYAMGISGFPQPVQVLLRLIYHNCLSTINFLISAIALAGLRAFGQVFAQFMMV